jgi:hypothetical protein
VATKYIGGNKILASTKYWRQQNIGVDKTWRQQDLGVDKISASTKYWRRQNLGVDKISASTKYWHWQNLGVDKMLAHARKHILTVLARQSPQQLTSPRPSLMFSFFSLKMLCFPRAVTKCVVAACRSAFMGRLSPALYRLICTGRHAENVTNIGVDKISAPAKISLIFAKL